MFRYLLQGLPDFECVSLPCKSNQVLHTLTDSLRLLANCSERQNSQLVYCVTTLSASCLVMCPFLYYDCDGPTSPPASVSVSLFSVLALFSTTPCFCKGVSSALASSFMASSSLCCCCCASSSLSDLPLLPPPLDICCCVQLQLKTALDNCKQTPILETLPDVIHQMPDPNEALPKLTRLI